MYTNYGMEIVRATEIAALTAARMQGHGNQDEILNNTRGAITKTLNRLAINGTVINDRFIKRKETTPFPKHLGQGGPEMDLMAVALEAHHSAADGLNNSTSYAVIAKKGTLQSLPNLSMYKIVIGPEAHQSIDINQPPTINVKRVARALRKYTENVTVCILDQARHQQLIKEVRSCGARIKLIVEGEISGCLAAITGEKADIYMGYGYAPESVMVAAGITCLGGYFEDLIRSKEVAIAATGITDGEFLEGVRFTPNGAITTSFIARGETRTYRRLETRHFFDYKPVF